MLMVLAGVHLVFKKKYLLGGILTMIAAALEIAANHFQMTYYLLIFLLIVTIYYTVYYIKQKEIGALLKMFGIFVVAGIVAIGLKDRKSTRLNSSHVRISYAVFCLKKKKKIR